MPLKGAAAAQHAHNAVAVHAHPAEGLEHRDAAVHQRNARQRATFWHHFGAVGGGAGGRGRYSCGREACKTELLDAAVQLRKAVRVRASPRPLRALAAV